MTKKVGILISGNGSNLQALIDAVSEDSFPATIEVVISNKADAYGLKRAQKAGIPTCVISHKDYDSREQFDQQMDAVLAKHNVEIVCMAGFMRLLSPWFVKQWFNRLLNIHPSLLPSFKGVDGQKQALDYGVKFTGCTVHFVRDEMDVGPIIVQGVVEIQPDDTVSTLTTRILAQEHQCYPQALKLLCQDKIIIDGEKTTLQF